MNLPKGWNRYDAHWTMPNAVCFYQKRLKDDLFITVQEFNMKATGWTGPDKMWELEFDRKFLRRKRYPLHLRCRIFSYDKFNLPLMERHAKRIISRLSKLEKESI